MAKVMIMDTILRDAHQSQAVTRMRTEQMIPALEQLDDVGYYSLEGWGGATFDTCMRYLNEDPWERLRTLRKYLKKTPIQMLLRGQNLLGYRNYADDLVEKVVEKSLENGVRVIRVFDALNDPRNIESSMRAIKKYGGAYGGVCEAAISYTTSPVHTPEYFVKLAKTYESMGADNICIKDMANLLLPFDAYKLVKALKEALRPETKLHMHTHNTTGTGDMVNLMAIFAGVDIVDTALSPLANGTSQPTTESLVATLMGTEYDTGIDLKKLTPVAEHFRKVAAELEREGSLNPKVRQVNVNTLIYQVPGGMLSNLMSQLKKAGREDKLDEVLAEVPHVRADCGYPPLVTPSSQIVGTQAVLNVVMGERYKMVTKEMKDLFAGKYGKLPMPVNEAVAEKVLKGEKRIDYRPADDLQPEFEALKAEVIAKGYYTQDEDVLSYASFPEVAENFFKWRKAKNEGVDAGLAEGGVYPV